MHAKMAIFDSLPMVPRSPKKKGGWKKAIRHSIEGLLSRIGEGVKSETSNLWDLRGGYCG